MSCRPQRQHGHSANRNPDRLRPERHDSFPLPSSSSCLTCKLLASFGKHASLPQSTGQPHRSLVAAVLLFPLHLKLLAPGQHNVLRVRQARVASNLQTAGAHWVGVRPGRLVVPATAACVSTGCHARGQGLRLAPRHARRRPYPHPPACCGGQATFLLSDWPHVQSLASLQPATGCKGPHPPAAAGSMPSCSYFSQHTQSLDSLPPPPPAAAGSRPS